MLNMMYMSSFLWVMITWIAACTPAHHNADSGSYNMVWQDEFDKNGLPDTTKWAYNTGGHGWGNNELQYYTFRRLENARVDSGLLIIEARKENWEGKAYTSARLTSARQGLMKPYGWKYGKIEVRAKLPKGLGTWPAIWMLGDSQPLQWPDDGEIDIMEHVGWDQGRIHGSIHCKKYYHSIGTQKTANTMVPDCSEQFHRYGVEWDTEKINVTLDDRIYFTFINEHTTYAAWPFDHPMYLLLNLAVGGSWGGQKGIDDTIWPQRMWIDYVRVWQKNE